MPRLLARRLIVQQEALKEHLASRSARLPARNGTRQEYPFLLASWCTSKGEGLWPLRRGPGPSTALLPSPSLSASAVAAPPAAASCFLIRYASAGWGWGWKVEFQGPAVSKRAGEERPFRERARAMPRSTWSGSCSMTKRGPACHRPDSLIMLSTLSNTGWAHTCHAMICTAGCIGDILCAHASIVRILPACNRTHSL